MGLPWATRQAWCLLANVLLAEFSLWLDFIKYYQVVSLRNEISGLYLASQTLTERPWLLPIRSVCSTFLILWFSVIESLVYYQTTCPEVLENTALGKSMFEITLACFLAVLGRSVFLKLSVEKDQFFFYLNFQYVVGCYSELLEK